MDIYDPATSQGVPSLPSCVGALDGGRTLGSEKVREKKVDCLSKQQEKEVDYLCWIFSLLNFVIYGVYKGKVFYNFGRVEGNFEFAVWRPA
jgi:hypothetical protein